MFTDLIWDFDGTLFDTYPVMAVAFQKALIEQGIEDDSENIFKLLKISLGCAVKYYENKYHLKDVLYDRFHYYDNITDVGLSHPMHYAKEICSGVIKKGGRNFIFTHRGESIYKYLNHYDFLDYFTEIVTFNDTFKRKPDPNGFLHIINKHGIDKEKALAVGDREIDILAAYNAGIKSCLLDTEKTLQNVKCDFSVQSLEELYHILNLDI